MEDVRNEFNLNSVTQNKPRNLFNLKVSDLYLFAENLFKKTFPQECQTKFLEKPIILKAFNFPISRKPSDTRAWFLESKLSQMEIMVHVFQKTNLFCAVSTIHHRNIPPLPWFKIDICNSLLNQVSGRIFPVWKQICRKKYLILNYFLQHISKNILGIYFTRVY